MTAIIDILKDSLIAIISGGGGVGAAAWKLSSYLHTMQERIRILEEKVDACIKKVDAHIGEDEANNKELKRLLEEVADRCAKCRQVLSERFEGNRAEHIRFVSLAAFNSFVKEQNEQWQDINRMLGRIEGELTARRGSWTNET